MSKSVCMLLQNPYDGDVRVRRKAEALVAAGYSVDVLALRGSRSEKTYVLNGVTVHTVGLGKRRGSMARYVFEYLAFFLWSLVRVTGLMWHRRYAVVDANTLPDFLIFSGTIARWMGAKLVLDMHEITPEFYMSKYGIGERSRAIRLLTWLERVSFDHADHVITIHEPIRELLVGRGLSRAKSTVVMNAVDEGSFVGDGRGPTDPEARSTDGFVMMYHGTLTSIYGLQFALEAFARVHGEMPGAELWILGDGPERESLKRAAELLGIGSKVRFLGSVPPTDVVRWLRRCDIGVLPLRRDVFLEFAFPNKLSEYIILGKSVIVPRLKTLRHYFSEEALAYFEPNDAADLARQMVRVYRDGELRGRLAAAASAEYVPIRWDVMRERYLTVIGDLAGSTTPATARPQPLETQVGRG